MLQLYKVSKAYTSQTLFKEASWQVTPGERVGLAGPNGSGKTTLLRLLTGSESPDAGEVSMPKDFTVGYLPQEGLIHHGRQVREEALTAFAELLKVRDEQRELELKLETLAPDSETYRTTLERYGHCQDEWQRGEGFTLEARTEAVLSGLGFVESDYDKPTETFSGGWQMRIALAKLLLARPNMLLLDEPTNHLDIVSRQWLEEYLASYEHAIVLVSHDRYFLDRVVTRITEIDRHKLVDYTGNYTTFLKIREKKRQELIAKAAQQRDEIERIERFISRFRFKASKAAQVQSRVKMLEKMERIEIPPERTLLKLRLPNPPRSGRIPMELTGVKKTYEDKRVLTGVDLIIERGDRLAIVGPNGVGKSTLMRLISGVEPADDGTRTEGHNAKLGFFGQDRVDLDMDRTVLENMTDVAPIDLVPRVRNILGAFLFRDDAVDKRVAVLSGGEKSRLGLARLLLRPANLLLLDEPTNHLDLDSKEILLEALKAYPGTLVFVSHDRYFLTQLSSKVAEIEDGKLIVHRGGFEDYLWHKNRQDRPPESKPAAPESPEGTESTDAPKQTNTPAKVEAKVSKNQARAMKQRLRSLEETIEDTETAIDSLEGRMAVPNFYDDGAGAQEIVQTHQDLKEKLASLYQEWEGLAEKAPKS